MVKVFNSRNTNASLFLSSQVNTHTIQIRRDLLLIILPPRITQYHLSLVVSCRTYFFPVFQLVCIIFHLLHSLIKTYNSSFNWIINPLESNWSIEMSCGLINKQPSGFSCVVYLEPRLRRNLLLAVNLTFFLLMCHSFFI